MIHDGATIALDTEVVAAAQLIGEIYAALDAAGYELSVENLQTIAYELAYGDWE